MQATNPGTAEGNIFFQSIAKYTLKPRFLENTRWLRGTEQLKLYVVLMNIPKFVTFWDSQILSVTDRVYWVLINLISRNAERVSRRVPAPSFVRPSAACKCRPLVQKLGISRHQQQSVKPRTGFFCMQAYEAHPNWD